MIISHKYKFIFLKTRKTAGTSIEIALSKFCGEDDIITPIMTKDEEIRTKLGYRGPQNYRVPYRRYSLSDWHKKILRGKSAEFYHHVSAPHVRRWVGPEIWNSYYKFCFERNPWDKAVSRYYFDILRYNLNTSFNDYVSALSTKWISNYNIYTIDDKLAVDFVGLYEQLQDDLDKVTKTLNLPEPLSLPNAKGEFRKDKRPYQDVLDDKGKEIIGTVCRKEIELFGYHY